MRVSRLVRSPISCGDLRADAAEPDFALGRAVEGRDLAALRRRAFRGDDQRRGRAARHPLLDMRGQPLVGKGNLGNQDDIRAAGQAAVQRDPARVAAHDLQHHDALVAGRRGVQAVERIGHALHRGIETEGRRRGGKIVVDRLRHADHGHAVFKKLVRRGQRAVAADADQRAHAEVLQASSSPRR